MLAVFYYYYAFQVSNVQVLLQNQEKRVNLQKNDPAFVNFVYYGQILGYSFGDFYYM